MNSSIILLGGSGHAKVVIDCIRASGRIAAGILDDGLIPGDEVLGVPILGHISEYAQYPGHSFIIAIGNNYTRQQIAGALKADWATVVHPSAVVSPYASIGPGTVVMPGAVINAGAMVGSHCIINTASVVEHDNRLADFVHLSPGAVLGGTVTIGEASHIGIGVSVRNNLTLCGGCTIGAGAAVTRDITCPGTYAGVPAGRLK